MGCCCNFVMKSVDMTSNFNAKQNWSLSAWPLGDTEGKGPQYLVIHKRCSLRIIVEMVRRVNEANNRTGNILLLPSEGKYLFNL